MIASQPGANAEWRTHWTLVLAAAIGFSFMSFMTAAAGVFMTPLEQEFGWSRTQLSLGLALSSLTAIFLNPFFGLLVDRWGTRRVALPGIALTSAAVAAFSLATGSMTQWIILWLVWGICTILVQSTVWSAAVAKAFSRGRGLALGITMAGSGLAQIIAPPLANLLIETQGWRAAYVFLGFGWGGLAFALASAFLVDVRNMRRPSSTGQMAQDAAGLSIREACRDTALWRIGLSTFLILTVTIAVTVHQVPILIETGATSSQAASLASLSGAAAIIGKIVTGLLLDRFHGRWIGGLTLASTAVGYPLMMAGVGHMPMVVIGIMISGYAAGTKLQLCGYLTSRYGGLRNFGTIFGTMTSMIALASALGPLMAGIAHDRFGSYAPLLWMGVALSLVSGGLVFSLGRYPKWSTSSTTVERTVEPEVK